MIYFLGNGVLQDPDKALRYLKKSKMQEELGLPTPIVCNKDQKIEKFLSKIYTFLNILQPIKECTEILSTIENMILEKRGKSILKAFQEYREDALKGNSDAQLKLGILYRYGVGVIQDLPKAVEWFREAVQNRNDQAQKILGVSYRNELIIFKKPNLPLLKFFDNEKLNLKKIQRWPLKMAHSWVHKGHAILGELYANGVIPRLLGCGDEEVFSWLYAASFKGDVKARYRLGRMHEYGWGTPKDEETTLKCFQKAADEGYGPAQKAVAEMYREGRGGVNQSNHESLRWYRPAAKQGDAGASAAIKDMVDQEEYSPAMYELGRAHEEGWGIARDEDEAVLQYENSALNKYFKGQYAIAVWQLEGKAPFKEELAPLELLSTLSGEEARRNYLSLVGKKLESRKERKKRKKLEKEGLPKQGYYKAQHKLAELYAAGQAIPFKKVQKQMEAYQEAIRLYEKAGEAISYHKEVMLEPLEKVRTALNHLQQLGEQEKFELDYPGFKEFIQESNISQNELDNDFKQQMAFVFDKRKTFSEEIASEIEKVLQRILKLPVNSKASWGLMTMLKTVVTTCDFEGSEVIQDLTYLSQKIHLLDPLWCLIPSFEQIKFKPLKICSWMLSDPRIEIFNSCFWEFEKEAYEDTFQGAINKIQNILGKLNSMRLDEKTLSKEELAQIHYHLKRLLTHDGEPNNRFKRRLVRISDIVQEKLKDGKVRKDKDLLISLKEKLLIWAERGQGDCRTGGEDELSKFYLEYIIDSKGGNAAALTKEDWSLEMQVAVCLANLRLDLLGELVEETDEDKRIHILAHLKKKARVALGLMGDAENYDDRLERTIDSRYLAMTTQQIVRDVINKYTPERMIDYIIHQITHPRGKEEGISQYIFHDIFYTKLKRRLQFQFLRESITESIVLPEGTLDRTLFYNEEYVLDQCSQEDFEKHVLLVSSTKNKQSPVAKNMDWNNLKEQAYMKVIKQLEEFYDEDYRFTPQGARALLKGLGYLEED